MRKYVLFRFKSFAKYDNINNELIQTIGLIRKSNILETMKNMKERKCTKQFQEKKA